MKDVKIAYIGGGSKLWARVFMYDLALDGELCGEIALYDIDEEAAIRNKKIGDRIGEDKRALSKWRYTVCKSLPEALKGATFVVMSILPATLKEMRADVHLPEKYGIYQSVGDTVGPGGVLRAMRTVPLYEDFAAQIKTYCPDAWIINFTNPMTICTRSIYGAFPEAKAFGCCHEVFHAQEFLSCVAAEELRCPRPDRHEIIIDASGVNHFTWITEATYKGVDLLKLLPSFTQKYFERGYCEQTGHAPDDFKNDPFLYGNKVKMDLFRRYGALAAAGDRHLVECLNNDWYLSDPKTAGSWLFHLTSVDYREKQQNEKIAQSERLASGEEKINLVRSDEEAVPLMKAVLGGERIVSNVNMPNLGQMPDMPRGAVVETNCVFSENSVKPVVANRLPTAVNALVARNCLNIETLFEGITNRCADEIFAAFVNQPLCSRLTLSQAKSLFNEMVEATAPYLKDFYDLNSFKKV